MHIRNWKKFQHYKDRNPPWIKLHFSLLSSKDWVMLDDASRVLAIACMLIASRDDGKIPNDLLYIKRVAYLNSVPNLKPLIDIGFVVIDDDDASVCKQMLADARPETEAETEKNPPISPLRGDDGFDFFWKAYPKKIGKDRAWVIWKRKKPPLQEVLESLQYQKQSDQWQKEGGQFIPHPATWLNQGRWKDEIRAESKNQLKSISEVL